MLRHRRLLAFEAVCRFGSALKAAEHVHMTQPSITAAIAGLEDETGARLFERTSRGMSPTSEGRALHARVEAALSHLKDAELMIAARRPGLPRIPLHRLISEGQIRALSAVVENGGFSEGARRLGLAQPSVHRAVRDLETLCGIPLFRQKAEATPEARELSRHCTLYRAELALGLDEIHEIQGVVEGTVTVGALPLARAGWLPDAVAATLATYPLARIRIIDGPYEAQLYGLMHGEIDFILGALRPSIPKQVEQFPLFDDALSIVVRADHPFAVDFDSAHDKLTPPQLDSLSWILPRPDTPGRQVFDRFMFNKGLTPPVRVIECASVVATRAILLRTDHAALLSARQVEHEIAQGLLKIMGPPLTGSSRTFGLTLRRGFRPTTLHKHLLSQLETDVADL